ncbi:chromate transporter family protein [Paraburkholderia xenovorans LB400]|uniref:Chromate efflux pump n=1 Tax=Paraburkholderia xenovorans (strain LB400) TaxID=266265 RepID=Q13YC2_PARXL|nr:chromate transporter [Paraburkholderia xenovorans]ABE30917.1 Chromate efflux pump [Paraburkholderia xenovorans LB400]AIP30901.1 chromate transporter family protein [Paraburkholderia xenovorans LB400]NPT39418.1 chromate transporter [Paraburkholderia xenovorans]
MQSVSVRKTNDVSLLQILLLFARVGLTSFGGGLSAWIYREVVTQRGWLDEDEFLGALTLGQILPGSNVINLSIYVGYRMKGAIGSTVAVSSLLVPPMVVIVLLATVFHQFAQLAWLHEFLEGVAAAAIGMTASVGFRTARSLLAVRRWPLALIAVVFVAVGVLRWPLVPVALVAGAAGLYLASRSRHGAR